MGRVRRGRWPRHEHRRRQPQRRVWQHQAAFGHQPADAVPGPGGRRQGTGIPGHQQRADRRDRRSRQQPQLLPPRVRRGVRPRRPVHQHRRRQLRDVEGGVLQQRHSAQLLVQRALAADQRRQHAARLLLAQRHLPAGRGSHDVGHVELRDPAQHDGREFRGLDEVAVVRPRRLQRGQDERHQAGERRARDGLGQRVHRIRRAGRLQDAEHGHRGRLQQQAVRDQARVPAIEVHRRQRSDAVAELLHAQRARHVAAATRQRSQEVEPERVLEAAPVGFGAHRALHAEQADEQRGLTSSAWTSGLKPTSNFRQPAGESHRRGLPRDAAIDSATNQNLSNFDGNIKKTTANVAWNASPMAQLDTRVYYDYYDKQNDSTTVSYATGPSQGTGAPATTGRHQRNRFTIPTLARRTGKRSPTRRTRPGSTRRGRSTAPTGCSAGSTGRASSATSSRSTTRPRPSPTTTATGSSTRTAAGTT